MKYWHFISFIITKYISIAAVAKFYLAINCEKTVFITVFIKHSVFPCTPSKLCRILGKGTEIDIWLRS